MPDTVEFLLQYFYNFVLYAFFTLKRFTLMVTDNFISTQYPLRSVQISGYLKNFVNVYRKSVSMQKFQQLSKREITQYKVISNLEEPVIILYFLHRPRKRFSSKSSHNNNSYRLKAIICFLSIMSIVILHVSVYKYPVCKSS